MLSVTDVIRRFLESSFLILLIQIKSGISLDKKPSKIDLKSIFIWCLIFSINKDQIIKHLRNKKGTALKNEESSKN